MNQDDIIEAMTEVNHVNHALFAQNQEFLQEIHRLRQEIGMLHEALSLVNPYLNQLRK